MTTKQEALLNHLCSGKSLTSFEAKETFGIRVDVRYLKKRGYTVGTKLVTQYGRKVKKYYIINAN